MRIICFIILLVLASSFVFATDYEPGCCAKQGSYHDEGSGCCVHAPDPDACYECVESRESGMKDMKIWQAVLNTLILAMMIFVSYRNFHIIEDILRRYNCSEETVKTVKIIMIVFIIYVFLLVSYFMFNFM